MTEEVAYKFVTKDALTYLTFTSWEKDERVVHGFSTRSGGVSQGELSSLNLGFNRGDQEENVIENYKRMCQVIGVPFESLVLSKQVHETHIAKVGQCDCGNGILTPNKWESMDGLYTNEKGVTLVTHYADCVPLFFYAPKYGMIGMAHAGWRGTVGEIGKRMVDLWVTKEGIPASEIEVAIGPSIGPCHFEVDEDVASAFIARFPNAAFIKYDTDKNKYCIDLWECNKQSLLSAGILEEHVIVSGICTCCHDQIFFSHRKTSGKRGTLGAFMSLK
ncbi:MAG: peptidoglycan editing factor PgeF [Cellulosilyticum sp.]|nr:peptidoglycan editing factor PgeF [Cellulosilyticum sp.]